MNAQAKPHSDEVPVLTEVIGFSEAATAEVESVRSGWPAPRGAEHAVALPGATGQDRKAALSLTPLAEPEVPLEGWLAVAESQITQQVLGDVQRQVDRMFEYRLREALGPVLERLAAQLVADTRTELATTLKDVVRRAVAQELARLRSR